MYNVLFSYPGGRKPEPLLSCCSFVAFLVKTAASSSRVIKLQVLYTGTLDPEHFSGAVFTHTHFQKRPKYPAYAIFHYIS